MKKILTRCTHPPDTWRTGQVERFPIYILLDNVRSLYNVGAIFRTADAARVSKLYLCGITGYPPRKEITKTALGSQSTVPWEYSGDAAETIRRLRSQQVAILAVEHTDESMSLWDVPMAYPICLVFGYEIEGISQEILDLCDYAVEIPMFGYKGSLNVAVSCSIVLYEAIRRRTFYDSK